MRKLHFQPDNKRLFTPNATKHNSHLSSSTLRQPYLNGNWRAARLGKCSEAAEQRRLLRPDLGKCQASRRLLGTERRGWRNAGPVAKSSVPVSPRLRACDAQISQLLDKQNKTNTSAICPAVKVTGGGALWAWRESGGLNSSRSGDWLRRECIGTIALQLLPGFLFINWKDQPWWNEEQMLMDSGNIRNFHVVFELRGKLSLNLNKIFLGKEPQKFVQFRKFT